MPGWIPKRLRTPLRVAGKSAVVLAFLGIATGILYVCLAFRYDLAAIERMPERSVVADRNGIELATLHGENRRLITREEIPGVFVEALLAREDKRFMSHHGVDVIGFARAMLRNVRDLAFTQGASTLTMQLARNSLDLGEHDLHRKGIELALALRIESRFSKDEILTAYVNRIYFGSGCHGLEEAARRYFDRPAAELNANQCALLAGIIRAPHACSPLRNLDGALAQRDEVVARLVTEGHFGEAQAVAVREEPLGLADGPRSPAGTTATQAIRRHFETLLAARDIRRGGLHLTSTLDAGLQATLEAELASLLERFDPDVQAAGVCVDPATGAIRAIVGGRASQSSSFNRALDARRDVGPVFAPFLFAAAAERGCPLDASQPVRTGREVGPGDMVRLAKRLGFRGPFGEGDDLYRGALSATPLELATAAATLVNGGKRPRTYLLDEIRAPDDTSLFTAAHRPTTALGPEAAAAGFDLFFTDSAERGGRPPVITGASLSRTDAWGILFGTRHAVCIWIGHDRPRPLDSPDDATQLLHRALGSLDDASPSG